MITEARALRDQAMDVVAVRLNRAPPPTTPLAEFGAVVVVQLLIDLEEAFAIGLDPDEVLPNGTLGVLLALVEMRARTLRAVRAPCVLFDLQAERARRAQSAEDDDEAPMPAFPPARPIAPADGAVERIPEPCGLIDHTPYVADQLRTIVRREASLRRLIGLGVAASAAAGAFGAIVYFAAANGWAS